MRESNNVTTEENERLIDQYKGEDPFVILIVGVNGVGKTTSIGKLAYQFKSQGKNVLLGAADTFRAGAVNQLKIWSERADVPIIQQGQNADPAAVAFDTVNSAKARGSEVVLIDTAGRLHNKAALMEELTKIKRVMSKVIEEAPHEVWLVLDGSTGQNAIQQAKAFQQAVDITGLILTKLDGTAKGGIVMAITNELKIPVRYIGIGEGIDDLRPFDAELFAEAILKGS
jgi:fused signal recognition particle receptor